MKKSIIKYRAIIVLVCWVFAGVQGSQAQQTAGIDRAVVQVHVTLDMQQAFFNGRRPDSLVLLIGKLARTGGPYSHSGVIMQDNGSHTWQAEIRVTYGEPADLPFIFAWHILSGWYHETLPGGRTHLAWLGGDKNALWVRMHYDPAAARVVPDSLSGGWVDQYKAIIAKMGRTRNPYFYDAAMQKLDAGDRVGADQAYARFRKAGSGAGRDEYPEQLARLLAGQGRVTQALALCRAQFSSDSLEVNKARLLYTEGTLLDEARRPAKARALYRQVLRRYPGQGNITGDARYSLGLSYLGGKQPDSLRRGIALLQDLFGRSTQVRRKRNILHALARGYLAIGDTVAARHSTQMLTRTGSPAQRLGSGLDLLEGDLKGLSYEQAMSRYQALLHPGQARPPVVTGESRTAPGGLPVTAMGPVPGETGDTQQRQARGKQAKSAGITRGIPAPLQRQAEYIRWQITCKQADRQQILNQGKAYLKNYPGSPYADWIRGRIAYMEAQNRGGRK